ncbi:SpoIIIAH-like family protein [Tepidibacter formicigenes]|jgi:stage III sporulation protein AH|uniref:Stage III sporulation protein AH n=1 Tax=Tepidibacter formicigenes DSM 15518 TaxID=1123349 RepID=A0A1M6L2U2_9FIRM|nr:SpoIIIAH-like family protein [Tepidibacter formicigenes]SHJ65555.1 stage III sporulation protein AH [Tepidibacter formicigenes DSM 15518]
MKFNGKFLKSRNFVIFTLVLMLVLVGTINYNLSKKSLLETSSELEEYEQSLLQNMDEDENLNVDEELAKETSKEDSQNEEIKVVDSNKSEVEEKVKETSANITQEMALKENMEKDTYFIDMKLNREQKRGELIEELDAIIKNPSSSQKSIDEASAMKLELVKYREAESNIENLLTAKGFNNPIVYISKNSANVIVDKEKLDKQDVAKIFDVVYTETKLPYENIKIMEYKR